MVGGPISAVQADNLFGNLPSLINIATAFNDALDYIVQDIEEDALALPMFGETILLHVSFRISRLSIDSRETELIMIF